MRRAQGIFLGLAEALALATAARLPAAWSSGNALDHASGTWIALADDLAHGTFYRPLHDPVLGYGGARVFPLFFVLHAGLVRAGAPLLPAGYALSLVAAGLLVLGAFTLLRRLGAPPSLAAAFAALTLGGLAAQHGATDVRADLLPAALSALGLAAVASSPPRGRIALGALLFGLAFAARPASLTALAAAVAWLALRRQPRRAAALAAATGALAAGVVLATDALSSGRFTRLVGAFAPGGAGDALRAPLALARRLVLGDPVGLLLVAAALVAIGAGWRALVRSARSGAADSTLLLPALWVAAAGAGALVAFATPGAGVSRLLELEVASCVALGASAVGAGLPSRLARLGALCGAAAGVVLAVAIFREDLASSRLLDLRALVRSLPPGPLLSEDPLVPIVAGRRPVLLDPRMLRVAFVGHPDVVRSLDADIARGAYPAIVLLQGAGDAADDAPFARGSLGPALLSEIRRTCRRAGGIGRYDLYVPRVEAPAPGPLRATALGGSPMVAVPQAR